MFAHKRSRQITIFSHYQDKLLRYLQYYHVFPFSFKIDEHFLGVGAFFTRVDLYGV